MARGGQANLGEGANSLPFLVFVFSSLGDKYSGPERRYTTIFQKPIYSSKLTCSPCALGPSFSLPSTKNEAASVIDPNAPTNMADILIARP